MGWFSKSSAPKKAPAPERPPPKAGPSVYVTHSFRGDEALVVMKSYEWCSGKLAEAFFGREPSETVRQYLSRLDGRPGIDAASLWDYADSFEEARYSDHPIGPAEKGKAILSMRAALAGVMRALDGAGQAAAGPAPGAPGGGGPAAAPYRFVAPAAAARTVQANGPGAGKDRPAAPPTSEEDEQLRRAWGAKSLPAGARIPEETISAMKEAMARRDMVRLGGLLLEQGDGPAAGWRAFLDSSLAEYLLEFDDQALAAGGARASAQERERVLRAGQVLAVAEGRDFFVPDDLKLSLLSVGTVVYRLRSAQVVAILEGGTAEAGAGADKPPRAFQNGLAVPVL